MRQTMGIACGDVRRASKLVGVDFVLVFLATERFSTVFVCATDWTAGK